jgi:pimeloyl-ACP methyl ester carboxylesterase
MPDRVTSCVIVSGAGSPEAVLDGLRGIRRLFTKAVLAFAPLFAWWAAMWAAFWAPRLRPSMIPRWIDRNVMRRAEVRRAFAEEVREALRPGGRAMQQDLTLFARPFGFASEAVGRVPVYLWHGDSDRVVPVRVGRYYAREIPGCRATFVPNAGHLMIVDHADAVVGAAAS